MAVGGWGLPPPTSAGGAGAGGASMAGPIMSGIGSLMGYLGQRKANKQNIALARQQMAFQERMSNSAYQRAMADMRRAGLNPILAARQPASSPGGQTARVDSALGAGVNAFNTTSSARAQIANLKANTNLTSAKAEHQTLMNTAYTNEGDTKAQIQAKVELKELGIPTYVINQLMGMTEQGKSREEIIQYLKNILPVGLIALGSAFLGTILTVAARAAFSKGVTKKVVPKVTKPAITAAQKKTVETFIKNGKKYYFDNKGVLHLYKGQ